MNCIPEAAIWFEKRGVSVYTVSGKKESTLYSILGITSSDTGRFSKFFHFRNLREMCNKVSV